MDGSFVQQNPKIGFLGLERGDPTPSSKPTLKLTEGGLGWGRNGTSGFIHPNKMEGRVPGTDTDKTRDLAVSK